ncbi:uncharacterized protein LOC115963541 [Quercus lobata]|uniref:uncharacterized protein LOC115963540 n=1 Tax=Quercus lobata TaxID=97700 RepID=UPI0012493D52|nr:uncharacterized protein LOC115963540 [Quercus lobata]XP_030938438.1 uncharacterized protein LOC115963541 [Quercus lobata]
MGVKRIPLTPLLELLEDQPGKDMQGTPQPKAPSPPPRPLTIQTRSSSTKSQPQSPHPALPAPSQPARLPRPEGTDPKRKRSPKGKGVMDRGKSQPPKEKEEAPRTKQLKIGHQSKGKEAEAQSIQGKGKGIEAESLPSAWLPAPMIHGGPLLETASLRDLGDGEGGYVANALGRTMLLPNDMDELRRMRMQEALQATYRMEEEVNNRSKAVENERKKRITASKTLEASEDELAKVKADLTITIRERDNVSAGLASAQKQAQDQTKRVLEAEDQLRIAKDLIEGLNKQLAAAVWEEALKRAGVDASSDLWKPESIFYPKAIREATSTSSVATDDQPEEEVTPPEDLQASVSSSKAPKEGELQDVIVISQHIDPEAPKEVIEPVVGIQVSSTEEPTTLAQPPQAIPLAVVPRSTSADPVQPSSEGTIPPGVEADPASSSQDVTGEKVKK